MHFLLMCNLSFVCTKLCDSIIFLIICLLLLLLQLIHFDVSNVDLTWTHFKRGRLIFIVLAKQVFHTILSYIYLELILEHIFLLLSWTLIPICLAICNSRFLGVSFHLIMIGESLLVYDSAWSYSIHVLVLLWSLFI